MERKTRKEGRGQIDVRFDSNFKTYFLLGSDCLRGCVCVLLKTQMQPVW